MTEEDNLVTTSDEQDYDADWIERIVGDFGLIDDDFDLESAADSLTADDRRALAARRRDAERATHFGSGLKPETTESQSTQTTQQILQATTDTRPARQPGLTEADQQRDELLRQLEECQQLDDLNLSCDYRKKEVIGIGGQGIVFKTECSNEHNLIKALKIFSPKPYDSVASYREDMNRMADVATLVYHTQVDNLVIIERFTYQNDIFMMLMRWVDGDDLASLLKPDLLDKVHAVVDQQRRDHLTDVVVAKGPTQSRLTPGVAVYITVKCLRALEALHNQGIVHGDIKPSNIMLDRFGSIRLVDIGSAFQLSTPPNRHTWTPMYAPPEVFEGGEWTPQSDLTSLGYVLVELLSGQPAVTMPDIGSASTRETSTQMYQQLLQEKRELPDRLEQLLPANVRKSEHLMGFLRSLIDPDPRNRFASADDALDGPCGTYQFLQRLTLLDLAAPFLKEIREWITDVRAAGQ